MAIPTNDTASFPGFIKLPYYFSRNRTRRVLVSVQPSYLTVGKNYKVDDVCIAIFRHANPVGITHAKNN